MPPDPSMDDLEPMMRRAVAALDRLADAVLNDSELPSEVVKLAEAVCLARAVLYTELARQGWTPPPAIPPDLELDRRLAYEPLSAGYDDPSP